MLKHVAECHIDVHPTEVEFRTKILSHHKTAFERQVKEAVLIRRNLGPRLMNSKQEYNRCYIPKIEVQKNGKDETDPHIDKENKSIAKLKDVLSIWKKRSNNKIEAPKNMKKKDKTRIKR